MRPLPTPAALAAAPRSAFATAAACASALAVCVAPAACGVEYRPGKSGADSARAVAARDSARRAAAAGVVGRVDTVVRTVVRVDTVRVRDTLPALGGPPPAAMVAGADSPAVAPAAPAPPGASPGAAPAVTPSDLAALAALGLRVPVAGVRASQVPDTFGERRDNGSRPHQALDILAPRGTPVLSASSGQVLKLFESAAGGHTVYVLEPSGRFVLYYAHLDAYHPGLAEGQAVRAGDALGTVGSTGNADPAAPHLHFAVARLADARRWWEGTPVDPKPYLR